MAVCIFLGIKDNLCDAPAVAKVDEYEIPKIPSGVDPAHQNSLGTFIISPEASTVMGSFPVAQRIDL